MDRLELPGVTWRRVSPRLVWVELVGGAGFLLVVLAAGVVMFLLQVWIPVVVLGVLATISIVNLALTPRRVRSIGYQLREDDLLFRRGIMWQRFVAVPYGRMQLVDINRGPIARGLGLSELKFVTAAAAAGVTIPGLPEAEAEELRDHLVSVAESRRAGL
ncbi:PH domain-containing protein [Glaciihabitans sp. INWT7]|uniref:PH domain-containing protein n=1 Tax=Glaciihabitans sp. INWT7 TaxID=2596912 RepID=UPI0016255F28|nr:PH domain-containing protein [Glaciihabitans sp. INWT7]QNE48031.1 PH domain-containing protein [Glaciihabitans sp. INWT7]